MPDVDENDIDNSDEDDVYLDLSEAEEGWEDLYQEPKLPVKPVAKEILDKIRSSRMMNVTQLRELPPVEWFVEGLIPAGPRTLLHGPGGSKKSFIVLDWMLCAATRCEWQGRRITPGRVLYIVGEGVSGLGKRLDAWLSVHPDHDPALSGVVFMPNSINLYTLDEEHIDLWSRVFTAFRFDYIVIDTVHQSMAGGEENSATDIGKVLENASRIAGDASLILVHHDPKATIGTSGPRGSSALRDSVDVCLTMEPHKTDNLRSILKPDKVRDAEPFRKQHLRFAVHGDGIKSSLYLAEVDDGSPEGEVKDRLELSEEARVVLAWMKKNSRGAKRWTTKDSLIDACRGMSTDRKTNGLRDLCQTGLVVKINGLYQIAPNPTPAE